MVDIDLEIRIQLFRARPELSRSHADSLIRGGASSCLDVRDDELACGVLERQDFVTFSHVDGVALVALFRASEVELFVFAADESWIHETEHLAMVEVQEFMQLARSRFQVPDSGLLLPMSQALPWMEEHRKAKRNGMKNHMV
jgi:hypothetical protein